MEIETETEENKDKTLRAEKLVEQWSTDEVAQWALKINGIEQSDAEALFKQRVNGKALLHQTKEDLRSYGIPGLPSSIIAVEIEKLNGPQQENNRRIVIPRGLKRVKSLFTTEKWDINIPTLEPEIIKKIWDKVIQLNLDFSVKKEGDMYQPAYDIASLVLDELNFKETFHLSCKPVGERTADTWPDLIFEDYTGRSWNPNKSRKWLVLDEEIKRQCNPINNVASSSTNYPGSFGNGFAELCDRSTEAFYDGLQVYYGVVTDLSSIVFWKILKVNGIEGDSLKPLSFGPLFFGGKWYKKGNSTYLKIKGEVQNTQNTTDTTTTTKNNKNTDSETQTTYTHEEKTKKNKQEKKHINQETAKKESNNQNHQGENEEARNQKRRKSETKEEKKVRNQKRKKSETKEEKKVRNQRREKSETKESSKKEKFRL